MNKTIRLNVQLHKSEGKLWGWYIPLDDLVVQEIKELGWNRLIANIDDARPLHCAMISFGKGRRGITLNKPFVKENGFLIDQKLNLELREDESKYGMSVSDEFYAALKSDTEAKAYFEKLTPGKQRNLIYFADNVKSSDIRIRRALVVMNHLNLHKGKIDFKDLTKEMKKANNRERLH